MQIELENKLLFTETLMNFQTTLGNLEMRGITKPRKTMVSYCKHALLVNP
jgi:hypothetical protein